MADYQSQDSVPQLGGGQLLLTTTDLHESQHQVRQYLGLVTGEAIIGVHMFRDLFAAFRDIFGGRAKGYENAMMEARAEAVRELQERGRALGADALIGMDFDYQVIGAKGSMLMASVTATAVKLERR
ncbi:MAG: heavy metal-binding domain-containing protein [Alphaproteobacteria bacterium]